MTKPTLSLATITQATEAWDGPVEDNFSALVDFLEGFPLPVKEYSAVQALPTASSYDRSLAFKDVGAGVWYLEMSDGTVWSIIPKANASGKLDSSWGGSANTLATLDGSGKVPTSQLPSTVLGAVQYQGTWNANTNTPNLGAGSPEQGDYYVVSVAGSTSLGGITDWGVGDWAIYNGAAWEKVDNSEAVTSVAGKTGAVALAAGDIASGTFVEARVGSGTGTADKVLRGDMSWGPAPLAALQEIIALADLTDVTAKTGTGTTVVMSADPTLSGLLTFVNLLMSGADLRMTNSASVTASTTQTQGQMPLTALWNIVNAANNGDVVTLPAAVPGLLCIVRHRNTTTLDVFPASGDNINALAANVKYTISATRGGIFYAIDATTWWIFPFGAA